MSAVDWDAPILPIDDVIEVAVFGKQVENFLASDVGRYLTIYADSQVREAMEALTKVSPWRRRKITELQNTILLWKGFRLRLAEALTDGEQAVRMLEDES